MQRKVAGAVVVVLVLAMVGCGGGTKPLSASEFRAQANKVCAQGRTRSQAALHSADSQGRRAVLTELVRDIDRQLAQLEALTPPEDLQPAYAQLRTTVKGARAVYERGLSGHFPDKSTAQAEIDRAHLKARVATALGLPACL